ncbi:MAG: hypothetical protein Q7J57_18555 [Gemmobacter sp.]|nr:hypothetical protein [Gemmobacter sp.]
MSQRQDQPHEPWAGGMGAGVGRVDLLSLVPLVAIVAILALVGALIWAVNRDETDRLRTKLATDALWVEQTLRFQMAVDEDMLVRLALEAATGTSQSTLAARARLHVANNPEVLAVMLQDAEGSVTVSVPPVLTPADIAALGEVPQPLPASAASARPIYGNVAPDATVRMAVRVSEGGGVVSSTLSLP